MKLFKKKEGSTFKIAMPLVSLIVASIILVLTLNTMSDGLKKVAVDSIARDYILSMEIEGYLTNESKNELISELQSKGLKNISLSGTTTSKVGYGKKINLSITGQVEIIEFKVTGFLDVTKTKKLVDIKSSKSSTAKH